MTRWRFFLAILIGPLCLGCASLTPQQYQYRFQPLGEEIQRIDDARAVQLGVVPSTTAIALVVDNKSDQSVQLLWDRCVYVDADSVSHRLVHSGVRFLTKEQPQTPAVIAAKSRLADTLVPSDYVTWNGSDWERRPLFPVVEDVHNMWTGEYMAWADPDGIKGHPEEFRGKEFSVVIALDIDGAQVEKTFRFTVAEVIGPPTKKP